MCDSIWWVRWQKVKQNRLTCLAYGARQRQDKGAVCYTFCLWSCVFVTSWVFLCPIAGPSAVPSPRSKLCPQFFAIEPVSETSRHERNIESGVACCYCKNEFYQITGIFWPWQYYVWEQTQYSVENIFSVLCSCLFCFSASVHSTCFQLKLSYSDCDLQGEKYKPKATGSYI